MGRSPTSCQDTYFKTKSKLVSSRIDMDQLSGNNMPTGNKEYQNPIQLNEVNPEKEYMVIKENTSQKHDEQIQDLKGSIV